MMKSLLASGVLWIAISGCATHPLKQRGPAFVSKRANEAVFSFSHRVEKVSDTKPTKAEASDQIEAQLTHLFGPMQWATSSAAPKEDHVVTITGINKKPGSEDTYEITYDYTGTLVVETGPRTNYSVPLPVNPETIYSESMVGDYNPCTDDHYQSEGDFWYFWSPAPDYPGCKLTERTKSNPSGQYEIVHGTLDRTPTEKTTYPEYHRLADKDGTIRIDLLFGMDDSERSHDPMRSKDVGADGYRLAKKELTEMGFKFRKWEHKDLKEFLGSYPRAGVPAVEEATLEYPNSGVRILVRLFFGETQITEHSKPFHYFFRDSLQNAAVMIYDGHSGLGSNLDLDEIADRNFFKFEFKKNKYQIYFFNSCSSYTYYNTLYFQRKRIRGKHSVDPKGTKNLDILANGLETEFDVMGSTNVTLIRAIHLWASKGTWTSYQRLAKRVDSSNLFSVNGDEDNPKEPVR